MKKLGIMTGILLLTTSVAVAGRSVDETRSLAPDGRVSVELLSGSVKFVGTGGSELRVSGTIGDDVEQLEITSRGDGISIEVVLPRGEHGRNFDASADLEIELPAGSTIRAKSVSADFSVEGVDGAVEIESVAGRIDVDGSMRQLEVGTVSGNVRLVSDAPVREAEVESVSGNIELRADLDASGDFSFETVSGDITLRLPGGVSAEFDVETFSGKIENELGPPAERTSEFVPSKSLEFSTGGGGARVEIESFSGRIELLID